MEHLAPISTPPWERVGCQLHRMDICKLSRFFIHLNLIEMQCILTLHYLHTSFRKRLNLNEHNKIQCRNTNEIRVGKLSGKGQCFLCPSKLP